MTIRISRTHRGTTIRATGTDAHRVAAAMFRPLEVDTSNPATCVGCGCTDALACACGCWWLVVDRAAREGVCSSCGEHVDAFVAVRQEQAKQAAAEGGAA